MRIPNYRLPLTPSAGFIVRLWQQTQWSVLALTLVVLLTAWFGITNPLSGQSRNPAPSFFRVFSKDGRESLTATCKPIDGNSTTDRVSCDFVTVRFVYPSHASRASPLEEFESNLEAAKKEDPEGFRKKVTQLLCSPSSEGRKEIERKLREAEPGSKRRRNLAELVSSCAAEDPTVTLRLLREQQEQVCDLWTDRFSLEFKRVADDQWLYQQERPGLLSVLKVYELTSTTSYRWTLTETRVPTQGSDQEPTKTFWSWNNFREYELPCEFVSHESIPAP